MNLVPQKFVTPFITTTSFRNKPLGTGLLNKAKTGPKKYNGEKEWQALLDHDWIPDAKNTTSGTALLTKEVMESKRPVLIPIVLKPRNNKDCPPLESGYTKEPKYNEQQLGILKAEKKVSNTDSVQEWACVLKESELPKALDYFYPRGQGFNPWQDAWTSILGPGNTTIAVPAESSVAEDDAKIDDSKTVQPGGGGLRPQSSGPGQNGGSSSGRGISF
jgi:hypothetical protein